MAEEEKSSSILLGGADDPMDEDEDEDELFQADDEGDEEEDANLPMSQMTTATSTATRELLSTIITPSPFPHHTTGPTSSRFRNAMQRITSQPESDTEAWQALITEVSTCYKSIKPKLHAVDAEVQLQLDWMESCYGTLLKYFPYSAQHYLAVGEILFSQSSRFGEEDGPLADYSVDHVRRQQCQVKLEHIFETTLGVDMEGQPVESTTNIPMCTGSVELWLLYVRARVRHARRQTLEEGLLRQNTNQAYELAVEHAGFCVQNHLLWKSYLGYAKLQENMVYLRSVYQRLVCHPMTGLDQLWQEYEAFERQQSEQLAAALIGEFTPKYQHARTVYLERNRVYNWNDLDINRLATPPNPQEWPEQYPTLQLWKTRTAYERTNPERLTPADLVKRIEQGYKEMICAWTYHPEVWHMWSMWEDAGGGGGAPKAIRVLELAQTHIRDCTLLPHAQAQLLEASEQQPDKALEVMQAYVERAPTTLGFALYQQMVRRYKGKDAARTVFAKARRVLVTAEEQKAKAQELKNKLGAEEEGAEEAGAGGDKSKEDEKSKRWMVTNRLDPSIGSGDVKTEQTQIKTDEDDTDSNRIPPGVITWHLYAADATIEHRLNKSPETAARVYELGLRKHASFLTQPAYVLKYAQLLLELQDNINLRALLTRALAACRETRTAAVAALWDMTLHFEALISIGDPSNVSAALAVERRRRAALMGPEVEDVATGSRVGEGSGPGIGAQKSTVSEQLIRQDGYDLSSSIVSGMSRTVDVLDVMGLWGNGVNSTSSRYAINDDYGDNDDESSMPGGKSDIHYHKRLQYARLVAAGGSSDGPGGADATGSKLLSARERLQQAGAAPSQNTAITLAIQQSPEWLRDLLLLLPASRLRTAVLSKPPPHLTEMALARLRQNKLPAERPQDDATKSKGTAGKKHQRGGGDSSDEEDGGPKSGGYGTQFRSRQRARQIMASSNGMKPDK